MKLLFVLSNIVFAYHYAANASGDWWSFYCVF